MSRYPTRKTIVFLAAVVSIKENHATPNTPDAALEGTEKKKKPAEIR